MPVIRDISLNLKTREVLRREGYRGHLQIKPEIKSLILELLTSVMNTHLLEPAIVYEIYPVNGISHSQSYLEGDVELLSSLLPSLPPGVKEVTAVVSTIGPKLEKQVKDYNEQGEPLRGLLLDGIGSAAVDSLTQEACQFIAGEVLSRGYQVSRPISPGMPGLPIAAQWQLLKMAPAREVGVSLTASGMMVPRKSSSMVMAIGPQMPRWTHAEACARCNLSQACAYRIPV